MVSSFFFFFHRDLQATTPTIYNVVEKTRVRTCFCLCSTTKEKRSQYCPITSYRHHSPLSASSATGQQLKQKQHKRQVLINDATTSSQVVILLIRSLTVAKMERMATILLFFVSVNVLTTSFMVGRRGSFPSRYFSTSTVTKGSMTELHSSITDAISYP